MLLSIFIDGLRPESLVHMPFLSGLVPHQERIKGEFGYSIACHGSMYSGVHTDAHKMWFVWQRAPDTSPFRAVRGMSKMPGLDNVIARQFLRKTAMLFAPPNSSFFGVPRVVHIPSRFLSQLDVTEKRNYDEPGYLPHVPSLTDLLREEDVKFQVIGMDKSFHEESKILEHADFRDDVDWMYWFLGDVDHFSHEFGQTSSEGIRRLTELDRLLERRFADLQKVREPSDILLWSDHGHIDVFEKPDLYRYFSEAGLNLNDFFHVIDATYARFWFDSTTQESDVRGVLETLGDRGVILEPEVQAKHRLDPGDNRFGDLIYALEPGYVFARTIWGWSRKMNSMHGYNPDYLESDGVVASTRALSTDRRLELIDVTPSILEALSLRGHSHMEGQPFWKS